MSSQQNTENNIAQFQVSHVWKHAEIDICVSGLDLNDCIGFGAEIRTREMA